MSEYEPELGQALFGQPSQEMKCDQLTEAALVVLSALLQARDQDAYTPFDNSGSELRTTRFHVESYSWGDDPQPYNFAWRDLRVSWYKYLGRGMSCNRNLRPGEVSEMVREFQEDLMATP